MLYVRTTDVMDWYSHLIEHYTNLKNKSKADLEARKVKYHNKWYVKLLFLKYDERWDIWDHYFTYEWIREAKAKLARAEYMNKLQCPQVDIFDFEKDPDDFFVWCKKNNRPV
jgi:hypothetical protein